MKERIFAVVKLVGWFIWFTVGLVFVVIGAGAAMGALTGNWINGVITMVGGALLIAMSEIGKTMISKMQIAVSDLQRAFTKAADSIEEQKK